MEHTAETAGSQEPLTHHESRESGIGLLVVLSHLVRVG